MVELLIRPTLHRFETCLDFVKEFHPGERDLVLTNKYIYEPYLGQMGLPVHTIYQEEYGAGEPTDVMVDAILADAARMGCTRVIAIGGGTYVHDIAGGVAFGMEYPDWNYHMHGDDEFLPLKQLEENTCMMAAAILRICGE